MEAGNGRVMKRVFVDDTQHPSKYCISWAKFFLSI